MNLDRNKRFPNQRIDGDPTECVGLTVSDIAGNIDGRLYDPDFSYAMALHIAGTQPTVDGSDPLAGMLAPVLYGLLPETEDVQDAKDVGELYVANWKNYTDQQLADAKRYQKNGIVFLNSFDEIVAHLNNTQSGASLPLFWYPNFNSPNSDGSLPQPLGTASRHNVAVYDSATINGEECLLIKPWLGSEYGQNGYAWLPRSIYETVKQGGYGFDPNAKRIISLIFITLWSLKYILNYLTSRPKASEAPQEPLQAPQPAVSPETPPQPQEPATAPLMWDTPENARHSVRLIADQEGLTAQQKDDMSRTVNCESGYGQRVVVYNTDAGPIRREKYNASIHGKIHTIDTGICQWNDYYHGGEISPHDAEFDPERAIRLMCQYVKAGKLKQWVCYSTGRHLEFSA